MLRSARKRMRGRRAGSRLRFQRLWNSFQAIWKAMKVLPVPVARVSRMRGLFGGDRLHDPLDGDVLVVATGVRAALVLEGHGGEAVAPSVRPRRRSAPRARPAWGRRRSRLPCRSACRWRRCPGRCLSRRSGRPACRRSPWPGPRPRSAASSQAFASITASLGCDGPARSRR